MRSGPGGGATKVGVGSTGVAVGDASVGVGGQAVAVACGVSAGCVMAVGSGVWVGVLSRGSVAVGVGATVGGAGVGPRHESASVP
jgi:hypothetical protein